MLEAVYRGEAAISRARAAKILQKFQEPNEQRTANQVCKNDLTPREINVLEQVVTGATNKAIAEAL
jgi:DNA-binding NarL/FixJ family response regulator